jgi:hypothetical protein
MTTLSRRIGAAGVLLALAFIVAPPAHAKSHLAATSAKAASSQITTIHALQLQNPFGFPPSYFPGGSLHHIAVSSREALVTRLLKTEDAAIARNDALLAARTAVENRLTFLEGLTPTTPQQARIIQLQIAHNMAVETAIQNKLNLNLAHLTATVPGIESAITIALAQISTITPPPLQAVRFVQIATVEAQQNSVALTRIIEEIPVSP